MKRQDSREIPHEDLLDFFALKQDPDDPLEKIEFGGVIKHGDLRHGLRLFKDRTSGVVRIEASALRGPMSDVPLWTAFITNHADDPHWAELEAGNLVSLVALRYAPYVFLRGYEPPRRGSREYILQFDNRRGMHARYWFFDQLLTWK